MCPAIFVLMTGPTSHEPTGRALDAAVAAHVCGLEVEERTNARTGEQDYMCREPGKGLVRVSFYASGLTSSITLSVKLRSLGWTVKESPFRRRRDPSGVAHAVLVNGAREVEGMSANFEEALCRAALRALKKP